MIARVHLGRLSAVYRVRRAGLERDLSLKTVAPGLDPAARRTALQGLRRDARARADLDHPAVVALYDHGRWALGPFVVGPWLAGGTFAERFHGAASPGLIVDYAEVVGTGLDALHARGWVHGDLSPGNLLHDSDGRPRIADLGSCVPQGTRWRTASRPTPRWLVTRLTGAPEIWAGDPVDGRADLYALGVLLYFLVTGSWPFTARRSSGLPQLHAAAPVPLPSTRRAGLGPAIDRVLLRALAKAPEERYSSGEALALAMREALTSPTATRVGLFARWRADADEPGQTRGASVDDALRRYMKGLEPEERQAFSAVLRRLQRQGTQATATLGSSLRGLLAPVAALAAAEELGVLSALAQGPATTTALAAACGLPATSTERLCQGLRVSGDLTLGADGWHLRATLASAYGVLRTRAATRRPVWQGMLRWGQLSTWVRTLSPPAAMDRSADGDGYVESVAHLGHSFDGSARQLAAQLVEDHLVPDRRAILDVGAGSAVWSLALAAVWPEATVTALDRPKVLEVARTRARNAGLADRLQVLAGDWQSVELAPASHGVIVMANVCHLLTRDGLVGLLARLGPALTADGRILVIDTIPERLADAPPSVIHYDLELALRTERGGVHELPVYQEAMVTADLELAGSWTLERRNAGLRVLLVRRSGS